MIDDVVELARQRADLNRRYHEAVLDERARLVSDLKARRLELGMTQQQVADFIGCGRAQIANGESTNRDMGFSVEVLIGYALAVGCRLSVIASDGSTP